MGHVGVDALGAALLQGRSGLAQRACGVGDVVDDDAVAVLDLADEVHDLGDVRARAALVDDRDVGVVEQLGDRAGPDDAAHVGGDHAGALEVEREHVVHEDLAGEAVVHRHVEEALDLLGVEIHGEHAVDADGREEVGHDLGGDRHAGRAQAAVLAGIAEVGDHRGDAACRGAADGIDHDDELHEVVVGRRAGRLDDEHVVAAHVLVDLHVDLAVAEGVDGGVAKPGVEPGGDFLGKVGHGVPGKELHIGHSVFRS